MLCSSPSSRFPWPALLTSVVLAGAIVFHLLGALLAGLLVHQLVHHLAKRWHAIGGSRARVLAVAVLTVVVILLITLGILGLMDFLSKSSGLPGLGAAVTEAVARLRTDLPSWAAQLIPAPDVFNHTAMGWLKAHSTSLQTMGQHTLETLARVLIGLIIGGMVALAGTREPHEHSPLVQSIRDQASQVALAFDRVVFAQFKISLVNTVLTGLFLLVIAPLTGMDLPFAKTLVVLTFVFGMLPVVGNLISNSLIVLVGLSVSPTLGAVALAFLVAVHKLEYFLNARIVGTEIQASSWEILLAMLIMEALFGLPGVILAPIAYAYLKGELRREGWV